MAKRLNLEAWLIRVYLLCNKACIYDAAYLPPLAMRRGRPAGTGADADGKVLCRGPCGKRYRSLNLHIAKTPACAKHFYGAECEEEKPINPAPAVVSTHYQCSLRETVFKDVNEMYYFRYFTGSQVQFIRESNKRWVDTSLDAMSDELHTLLGSSMSDNVNTLLRSRLDFFSGLNTELQVNAYARENHSVVRALDYSVGPDPTDRACSLNIVDWLTELMRGNAVARAHIVAGSDRLKSGDCRLQPTVFKDIMDGSVVRNHAFSNPWIDCPGQREIRLFLMLGFDEMEPNNPLGPWRGKHKMACFYGAIASINAALRFEHEMMALLLMVEDKILTKCDPVRVMAGADPVTGELIPGDVRSFGAQMRELYDGVMIQVMSVAPSFSLPPSLHRHVNARLPDIHTECILEGTVWQRLECVGDRQVEGRTHRALVRFLGQDEVVALHDLVRCAQVLHHVQFQPHCQEGQDGLLLGQTKAWHQEE